MNDLVIVQLRGLGQLSNKLNLLQRGLRNTVVREVVEEVTEPILQEMRFNVLTNSFDTGALFDSLGRRIKTYGGGRAIVAIVGPRRKQRGNRKGIPPSRYAHIIEFGSSTMAARPFMRPAIDHNLPLLAGRIQAGIERRLRALGII